MRVLQTIFVMFAVTAPNLAADPPVTIELGNRQGTGVPARSGFTHTGGGNIDVQQPTPDCFIITLTGVAVAGGHPCKDSAARLSFDICQEFEIKVADPAKVKRVRLTAEGRVIGLLRSHSGGGVAEINCPAHATVRSADQPVLDFGMAGRAVTCGENLSVNDRQAPVAAIVGPGKLSLQESFAIQASHPKKLFGCKAASAEFAPDPALDPLWISAWEPFHGASKKDFGFQVIIRVAPE